jgi:PhzF family phenazine biosynthesis protein
MKYYVIDSFTYKAFTGNSAGVCLLEQELDEQKMQEIAAELKFSETAFVTRNGDNYNLRWFTPETEVDLCGHGTLASAFAIENFWDVGKRKLVFNTKSGELRVAVKKNLLNLQDIYEMDFPAWEVNPVEITEQMSRAIGGAQILEAHAARDLLLLANSQEEIAELSPDFDAMREISGYLGIIVTAKGNKADFVSRFFAPAAGVSEDPVTGSAHAELTPFWAKRLNKNVLTAHQISSRGGVLFCEYCGDRVKISGSAVYNTEGEIDI